MRWLTTAESFGAPWAHSFAGWLSLLLPTTVLVILLEAHHPFPHFGLVLLSALVQHCFAGLVVLPMIVIVRKRNRVLPVWAAFTSWGLAGVARAFAGAAMVAWYTDADVDFPFRVATWLLVAWIWMPLLSYAVAQLENRQQLLAGRSEALRQRDEALQRRKLTAEQIRGKLVSEVRASTMTIIGEIESALNASRHQLDAQHLELVGIRLADVSTRLGVAVARLSEERGDTEPGPPPAPAPLIAALNFQRDHAWRWGSLSAIALAAVTLPLSFHAGGLSLAAHTGVALLIIAVVLSTLSRASWWGPEISARKSLVWSAVRHSLAGLAGTGVLWLLSWGEVDAFTIALLVILPYGAAVSAEILSVTVGISNANRDVLHSISELESDRQHLEATALENENRVRQELHAVMHGPILGRLSSCAMALNFLAAEATAAPSKRVSTVTAAVLDHLNDTLRDLSLLAD